MKVKAITKTNCFKCEWAKEKLKDFPVEWLDFDKDEDAIELTRKHNLNIVPSFLIFQDGEDTIVTQSALYVKKFLDRNL